jgi:TPR repeat protein
LAYGDTGTIIYLYEEKTDEAEEWFRKAEAENCLFAPAAYYFGLLLWMDRANSTDSFKYFKKAAEEGFETAYGQYGTQWVKSWNISKTLQSCTHPSTAPIGGMV